MRQENVVSKMSIVRFLTMPVAVGLFFFASAAGAVEIKVLISGGFSAALAELKPEFERATGHRLVITRAASMGSAPETIPSRLQRGEPADVLVMVGDALEELARQGRVAAGTRIDLALSLLGMSVRAGAPKPDIKTVETFKRAMLEAKSVVFSTSASGVYFSSKLFLQLGIADQMKAKSRSIGNEPVGPMVARGDAEVALAQISELLPVKGLDYAGPLPSEIQMVTVFSGAVAAGAGEPQAARALLEFLASPLAAPAIVKSAMEPMKSP